MPRFITNRWWTFILALILGTGLIVLQPAHNSQAASASGGQLGSGDTTPGGGGAPPPGYGDPDIPIGSAKYSGRGVVSRPSVGIYGMRTAGDGGMTDSALMWRLQVVMRALKGLYLR